MGSFLFTSESVTEGHPDKLADQVSDGVLDALMAQDPMSRVAVETFCMTGIVLVAGEVTTQAYVDIPELVRKIAREVGYTQADYGLDCDTCGVLTAIHQQSPDISMGVDKDGAGDQGMMFGYATDETPELMPTPIMMAHKLARQLAQVRKSGKLGYLRPDGKTQVTVRYEDGLPRHIDTVVISAQHDPAVPQETIYADVLKHVAQHVLPEDLVTKETRYLVNPTGRFAVGGPQGDTGLTGRKLIVDTYGGWGRHGGGAFSGKDPTKVDRSASYMVRYIAKNIVAAGLARRVEVQVAYAIGVAEPMSISVDTFGTGTVSEERIVDLIKRYFDLRPRAIINKLNLRHIAYRPVAAYGHFGRTDLDVPWERTDMAELLRDNQ
jgi:S-adenosylmethionine synthetase